MPEGGEPEITSMQKLEEKENQIPLTKREIDYLLVELSDILSLNLLVKDKGGNNGRPKKSYYLS